MLTATVVVFLILLGVMTAFWGWAVRLRNGAVADVAWGLGFVVASLAHSLLSGGQAPAAWLMTAMIAFWGVRLSGYIWKERVAGSAAEDARYAGFREKWGANANRNLLGFFLFQAVLVTVISLPVALAAGGTHPGVGSVQLAGLALWVAAFIGEWLADRQLHAFKSNPASRGKVCDSGLWRYSRHPNYFFEWLLWVGLAAMAYGAESWWLGLASPALMLFFLTKVTGIPMAEAQSLKNRGEAYRKYQQTTSAFVPWFRKTSR
jgi:steroid 5-alpha reductase family enzyme